MDRSGTSITFSSVCQFLDIAKEEGLEKLSCEKHVLDLFMIFTTYCYVEETGETKGTRAEGRFVSNFQGPFYDEAGIIAGNSESKGIEKTCMESKRERIHDSATCHEKVAS